MTVVWNDDNMKRKGRKTPQLPTSHTTFLQRAITHSETSLHKHSIPACICCLQLPKTNQSIKAQDTEDIFTLFMSGLKAGMVAKFPATVHPSSGAHLGLDSGKTAQGKPLVHPSFQGHLHYLLCPASHKAAECCLGPLNTGGLRDAQELMKPPCLGTMGQHSQASAYSGLT